jgi:ACS family glucarate transporter-like MFS transporter
LKKRHIVLSLLVALAILTFLDRISISSAGARMQEDLHISPEQWGWVLGVFVLSYGLFEAPTGAMGDRAGQRRVLTRIVLWWSAFTGATGATRGFFPLLATRFLFGAGEAGAYPNISGVIARWFPVSERARAQGFIWAASRLGGALAPLIVTPLQSIIGWRCVFAILGAMGVLWTLIWRAWYRDNPAEQPGVGAQELVEIGCATVAAHPTTPWTLLLSAPRLWLIVAMYFCYAWGSWFYFGWFPVYLMKGAGFTEAQMGIFSALPFLAGALGNLTGGFLSDRLAAQFGLRAGRRIIGFGSLAASSLLMVAMTLTRDQSAIVVLSTLGFGVADLMLPTAWSVCVDIGGEHAGAVTGIMNTAGQFGGFFCSVLFGYIVKATSSYHAPVWMIAAMVMVAAILFTRIDATRRLVPTPTPAAW